jgi:hypothetical protein
MRASAKESLSWSVLGVGFLGLAAGFALNLWGHPISLPSIPPTPPEFTNTATVRMSPADLVRTDGDTSGLACYSCHDAKKVLPINLDANGEVILAEPHKDLVMQHGRKNRNDHCINCHDLKNLEQLRVREGQTFKLAEGTRLCGSCHGPTYRDWEKGVHGRVSGYWDRKKGAQTRADCTSCHDPHSPAFPPIKPGPAPHGLRAPVTSPGGTVHEGSPASESIPNSKPLHP